MQNKEIWQNIEKEELEPVEIEDEAILSQVMGGISADALGGLGIATTFGAGVGALVGNSSGGKDKAGKGAATGAGVGLGLSSGLAVLNKLAERSVAAKGLRR